MNEKNTLIIDSRMRSVFRGWDIKINHAYAHGGKIIEPNSIRIFIHSNSQTFIVKADGVEQMIDTIGGVKVLKRHDL